MDCSTEGAQVEGSALGAVAPARKGDVGLCWAKVNKRRVRCDLHVGCRLRHSNETRKYVSDNDNALQEMADLDSISHRLDGGGNDGCSGIVGHVCTRGASGINVAWNEGCKRLYSQND